MSTTCTLKGGCLSIATQGLTGSPALTLWPCPRHRDLAYQRRLRQARGPGPEDVEQKGEHRRGRRVTRGPRPVTPLKLPPGPGDMLRAVSDSPDKSPSKALT